MDEGFERYNPDMEAMHYSFRTEPCFVCRMVQGEVRLLENIIYEDDRRSSSLTLIPGPTATPWWPPRNTASR
jgi:hypothetical protein